MHATTLLTLFTLPFSLAAPAPAPLNPSPPTDLHATTPPDVPLPDSVLPMLLAKFGGSLPAGMTKSPAPLIRMWIRGDDGVSFFPLCEQRWWGSLVGCRSWVSFVCFVRGSGLWVR